MLHYTRKKKNRTNQVIQNSLFWSGTKKHSSLTIVNNSSTLKQTVGSQGWVSALSEITKNSGNFVFEIVLDTTSHAAGGFSTDNSITNFANYAGDIKNTASIHLAYYGMVLAAPIKDFTVLKTTSLGTFAVNDVLALAFNMTEGKCYLFKNGVNLGAYFGNLTGKNIYPIGSLWDKPSQITGKSKTSEMKYSYPGYVGIGD